MKTNLFTKIHDRKISKRKTIAIVILTIFATALLTSSYVQSLYVGQVSEVWVQPPFSEASYICGQYNSTFYYAKNSTTGKYDYLSTNASYVFDMVGTNLLNGGKVILQRGVYNLVVDWRIRSNQIWEGQGVSTVINVANPVAWTGSVKNYHHASTPSTLDYNTTISNMWFNGSGNSFTSKGFLMELKGAHYWTIEKCRFSNANGTTGSWLLMLNGEKTGGGNELITAYNTIRDCIFQNASYDGVHIKDGVTPYGTGCMYNKVINCKAEDVQIGFALWNADFNSIIGCTAINCDRTGNQGTPMGICIHGSNSIIVQSNVVDAGKATLGSAIGFTTANSIRNNHCTIIGNTVSNFAYAGISLGDIDNSVCMGNIVRSITTPVATHGIASSGSYNIISNNVIIGTQLYSGIKLLEASDYTIVSNNEIFNKTSSASYSFIEVQGGDYNIIENNIMKATGTTAGYGVELETGSVQNAIRNNIIEGSNGGIAIASGCTGNQIEFNNVTNCPVVKISNSGIGTVIRWNRGYITENRGTVVNATATTFIITHGLAGTPARVFCSFNSTQIDSWKWTSTSSTITITVTNKATTDLIVACYWYAEYDP